MTARSGKTMYEYRDADCRSRVTGLGSHASHSVPTTGIRSMLLWHRLQLPTECRSARRGCGSCTDRARGACVAPMSDLHRLIEQERADYVAGILPSA